MDTKKELPLEEKFNKDMFSVISKIKERSLYTPKDELIEYQVQFSAGEYTTDNNQTLILKKIDELGVIRIVRSQNVPSNYLIEARFFYIKIIQPKFDELFKMFTKKTTKNHGLEKNTITIHYEFQTGKGCAGIKKFKFKPDSRERKVFELLYKRVNKQVSRMDILIAAEFYQDYENPDAARHNEETIIINEITTSIREKTGLKPEDLVINDGSLTLLAEII